MNKDRAQLGYLEKIIGQQGLEIVNLLTKNTLTDQQVAGETGYELNIVRRTLSTLYEHHLASYTIEREKETGKMLYLWRVDLTEIDFRLSNDAYKLICVLEKWIDDERNTVFYTCENHCGRYTFEMASGPVCSYAFVCPICEQNLYYDDTTEMIEGLQEKVDELKTDIQSIFYPENASMFELAQSAEE